ncbi:hypothetical protein ACMG4H_14110 [Corynebacterium glutamicum]|uniref:hypothetical protein n=1 Tax=Corynebacterium glutamicum TaxID=1718 RepID=UPI003C7CC292
MSLKIGGADPTKVMVGGVSATKIILAGQVAWQAIRKVTITAENSSIFLQGSETGSTDLVAAWTGLSTSVKVEFSANVICNKRTKSSALTSFDAGTIIPAGTGVQPTSTDGAGKYVFTEVTS